jgi:dihydrofolate synthase/folylpolyglutamate synthase
MEYLPVAEVLKRKPLYYKEIDYGRMGRAYRLIADRLQLPPLIRLVGTNGKGTTGRFLALLLRKAGKRVGHYTSPHLFRFNERIWIDGREVEDGELERANQLLQQLLPRPVWEGLSYFEYTTFLMAILFQEVEIGIVESGLGGEHDATAVFPYLATIFTPIHRDHTQFLGREIEEIIATKVRGSKGVLVTAPQPFEEQFWRVATQLGVTPLRAWEFLSPNEVVQIEAHSPYPDFITQNYLTAYGFLKLAREKWGWPLPSPIPLLELDLPGRLHQLAPGVWLDVGHNPLSATAIAQFFEKRGEKVTLIYGAYADKERGEILSILKPVVNGVFPLQLEGERGVPLPRLKREIEEVGLPILPPSQLTRPLLIYGSFGVAEEILKVDRSHFPPFLIYALSKLEELREGGGDR